MSVWLIPFSVSFPFHVLGVDFYRLLLIGSFCSVVGPLRLEPEMGDLRLATFHMIHGYSYILAKQHG